MIIDDASNDMTLKKIKQFDDKRLRLFENKSNLGLTKSLNILLDKSKEGSLQDKTLMMFR